jgi:hypothetical protein
MHGRDPVGDSPLPPGKKDDFNTGVVSAAPACRRSSQYTANEAQRAIEVIQLLIKVRDRCRAQGLIDW